MDINRYNTSTPISQQQCPVYGATWTIWTIVDFSEERKKEVYRKINKMLRGY